MQSADELRCRAQELREALPERHEAIGPEDKGMRLATLHRSADEELRVSWCTHYENRPFVNVRIWTRGGNGGWWPDKRGISIRIHELPDIADAIAEACDLAVASQTSRPVPPPPPPMPGRLPPPPMPPSNMTPTTTLPTPEPPADGEVFDEFAEP